jgi:hypothetical protein
VKLRIVAPRQGSVWVRKAFQVFRRQPLGLVSLLAACVFVSLVLGVVPWVGSIATLALGPAVSLLFMIASRRVAAGETAMPGAIVELVSAGRARLIALLNLGLAYVAAMVFLFWLASVLDNGALGSFLASLREAKTTAEVETAAVRAVEPQVQFGLMLRMTFLGLLSVPFWQAPGLVFWGEQAWAKSLFFSCVALWRNKGGFAIYGLAWLALWMLLLALISICAGLLGPERFIVVAAPLIFVFLTIFYASLWFTFDDCFSSSDPVAAARDDEDVDPTDSPTKGSS